MQTISRTVKVLGIAMLISVAMPVFAESAPVYDADQLPQQFDNGDATADQGQDLPPPPPAPQQQDATFVPMQAQPGATASPSMPVVASSSSSLTMGQRIKRVEQQVANMQSNDASAKVDSLQTQVQSLRAQVEVLTHQIQQMQAAQKTMYTDLDGRLTQVSSNSSKPADAAVASSDVAATTPTVTKANKKALAKAAKPATVTAETPAAKATDGQPNVAEEQQIYQTAYNLIKAKKYSEAVIALQKMLQKYPSGQFASNAHYWLGELYGLMGKNDQALTEFDTVLKSYTDSPRVSDAQLKVGLIYAAQFKWPDAKSAFKKVINHYPGTASARLAQEQLKQIKLAGH